jgi:uncharacterized Zn finger protein
MTDLPVLTESAVREWTGLSAFRRGQSLLRHDRIAEPEIDDYRLSATFPGPSGEVHKARAHVEEDEISEAACTCGEGARGRCQHVAALLLAWIHRPETFAHGSRLARALAELDRGELIQVISMLVNQDQQLSSLALLTIQALPGRGGAPDVDLVHDFAQNLLLEATDSEYPAEAIAAGLEDLLELGGGYETQGRYRDAATIYDAVADEAITFYEEMPDEEGDLLDIVDVAAGGLGRCAMRLEPGPDRTALLGTLYDLYCWDAGGGGGGPSQLIEGFMLASATTDERRQIVKWIRETLKSDEPWLDDYARLMLGGLWLAAAEEAVDDEEFLALCRQTGRVDRLVERLLAMDRVDEAAVAMAGAPMFIVPSLADQLVAAGRGRLAEEIVRQRLDEDGDEEDAVQLQAWLKARVEARGDVYEAADLAEGIFGSWPSLMTYEDLVRLADEVGRWEDLRPKLLDELTKEGMHALVIQIHLWEEDPEAAVEALEAAGEELTGGFGELARLVAMAVEDDYPEGALSIYLQLVDAEIAQRRREAYQRAAECLVRVRELQEPTEWRAYIANLRTRYHRLSALQDELNRAGL